MDKPVNRFRINTLLSTGKIKTKKLSSYPDIGGARYPTWLVLLQLLDFYRKKHLVHTMVLPSIYYYYVLYKKKKEIAVQPGTQIKADFPFAPALL